MSTTTWVAPWRSMSSRARRSAPPAAVEAGRRPRASRRRCSPSRPAPSAAGAASACARRAGCCGRRGPARGPGSARCRTQSAQLRSTSERSSMNGMQNAPPRLPSRGSASIHRSSMARSARPPSSRASSGRTTPAPRSQPVVPRHVGRRDRQRGEQVPPRQAAVVAVQAGLDPHPAAEVGERGVDGGLHRVERGPVDGVGEQRRVERVGPAAAVVDDVGLALDGVQRRGAGGGDRRPRRQLGVERGPAHAGVGVGGEAAHRRHRQRLGVTVGEGDRRR